MQIVESLLYEFWAKNDFWHDELRMYKKTVKNDYKEKKLFNTITPRRQLRSS